MSKRGQLSIFVIGAILIVAVILVIYLYPKINLSISSAFTPQSFLKDCIGPELKKGIDILAKQGGYLNPEGYLEYKGDKIKYLCYTAENYKTCLVQQPLLKEHFEKELKDYLSPTIESCFNGLQKEYQSRGFSVSGGKAEGSVSITPKKISVNINAPLTVTKDTTQRFDKFTVDVDSQMYSLLMTAVSIIEFESALGNSETTLYIRYYPDLSINKVKLSDGSTVYTLSNVVTGESFTFASRSLPWPAGYGIT